LALQLVSLHVRTESGLVFCLEIIAEQKPRSSASRKAAGQGRAKVAIPTKGLRDSQQSTGGACSPRNHSLVQIVARITEARHPVCNTELTH
jgi:hypothetical protein